MDDCVVVTSVSALTSSAITLLHLPWPALHFTCVFSFQLAS
jgi:hypothetical protein